MLVSSQILLLLGVTWLLPFLTMAAAGNQTQSVLKQLEESIVVAKNYESQQIQFIRDRNPIPLFPLDSPFFPVGGLFGITAGAADFVTPYGIQQAEAMINAIHLVNQNPFILNRTEIVYTIIDTATSVISALGATINLSQDNVTFIVGPSTVDEAFECANFANAKNITLISYSAPSAVLQRAGLYPFGRLEPNDAEQARGIVALIQALGWNLIVPLFSNDTYGDSGRTEFYSAAAQTNISFTCEATIPNSYTADDVRYTAPFLTDISACIASSIANVVLIYMDIVDAANVIASLQTFPENQRLTFIAADAWLSFADDPSLFAIATGISSYFIEGTVGLIPTYGNIDAFRSHFYSLSPDNNGYNQFAAFWELSFDCFLTDDASIPLCSEILTERNDTVIDCRCTGNENLTSVPIDPSVGYVQDSILSLAYALDRIIYNCSSIKFGNYCDLTAVSGSQIFDVMVAFPIPGITGPISFSGIDRIGGSFDVIQVDSKGVTHVVGTYNNETIYIDESLLHFKSPDTPTSSISLADTSERSAAGLIVISVSFIWIVVFCCTSFYLYQRRRNKIIKKSSPLFCQLMLLGMVMVYVGLILWSLIQTQLICILKIWIMIIGFGFIIGNLLAKTYRIFKIFNNIKVTTAAIRDRNLFEFSFAIILLEVVMLSIYTFATGLPNAVLTVSSVDKLYSYVTCQVSNKEFQTAMTATIVLVNVVLVLSTGVMAFLTRHIDSAYSESIYIGYTVYCYIILAIITLPLYFTGGDGDGSATRRFIERSCGVIIAMTFTWLALFGPKLRTLYREKRLEAELGLSTQKYSGPSMVIGAGGTNLDSRINEIGVRMDSDRVTSGNRFITAPLWRNRAVANRVARSYFPLHTTSTNEPLGTPSSMDIMGPLSDTSSKLTPIYEVHSLISEESLSEAPVENMIANSPDWLITESYVMATMTDNEDTEKNETGESTVPSL